MKSFPHMVCCMIDCFSLQFGGAIINNDGTLMVVGGTFDGNTASVSQQVGCLIVSS